MKLTPNATIQVMYSCEECGIVKRQVAVRARKNEDVKVWLEGWCVTAIARDHKQMSPLCRARTISETWIPVTGTDKVGGVVRN